MKIDIKQLERNKDAAILRAERGACEIWKDEMYAAGVVFARAGNPFTTDKLWHVASKLNLSTPEPRAMGSVIRKLVLDGRIRPTGNYRKSTRAACNRRPLQEWVGV